MRPIVILSFICELLLTPTIAQIDLDLSTDFLNGSQKHSGLPIAVYDINRDLLDDIVFLERGTILHVAYQNWDSEKLTPVLIDSVGRDPQWAMAVADMDKNGDPDIIIGGAYDNIKVYFQDNGSFTKVELNSPEVYVQSLNIVDIDGNGWQDIFLSNDIGYNEVWWNDVTGFKKDDTGLFTDLPEPMSKGNYGAEWIDVDGDGDLDLYVAKCHPDASVPDPRRINRLYINDGLGHFTEEANLRGIASSAQSWTGHFFDSDNDGDFDLLVTNHDQNAQLYINDGSGYFSESTINSRLAVDGPVIQSVDADLDLDGHQDLIIGGIPDFLYLGSKNEGFREVGEHLGLYDITSLALGDLNNDGKCDIYSTVLNLINLPSPIVDRILYNRSEGNFLNVYLQDRGSPTSMLGATVKVYNGHEVLTRTIRSGESYGIQNSSKLMFGLGEKEEVDSISVKWSDGLKQSTGPIKANNYVVFHSSGRLVKQSDHLMPLRDTICGAETLRLEAPNGALFYQWNSSESSRFITIRDSGYYQVDMGYADGVTIRLPGVSVYRDVNFSKKILQEGDAVICLGESVKLLHADGLAIQWSTGKVSPELDVINTGWYSGRKRHRCDEGALDSVFIKVLPNMSAHTVMNDTLKRGEDAVLESSTPATKWYADSLSQNPVSIGPELIIKNVQKDTQIFYSVYETYVPPSIHAGLPKTDSLYLHSDDLNATMIFDVLQSCSLHSVWSWTDVPGLRKVMLYDQNVKLEDSRIVHLDSGWNEVILDFELSPTSGRYRLTTDNDFNLTQRSIRSPRLGSSKKVEYPLIADEVLRIIESQYGRDQFNYFFDWTIFPDSKTCEGNRQRVEVVLESTNKTSSGLIDMVVDVFPNPSEGTFIVRSNTPLDKINVSNLSGNTFYAADNIRIVSSQFEYQYSITEKGVYIIKWEGGQKRMVIVN